MLRVFVLHGKVIICSLSSDHHDDGGFRRFHDHRPLSYLPGYDSDGRLSRQYTDGTTDTLFALKRLLIISITCVRTLHLWSAVNCIRIHIVMYEFRTMTTCRNRASTEQPSYFKISTIFTHVHKVKNRSSSALSYCCSFYDWLIWVQHLSVSQTTEFYCVNTICHVFSFHVHNRFVGLWIPIKTSCF